MQSIFNTILQNDPNFISVKDQNNILKSIILLKPIREIKLKFAKYSLTKDKTNFYKAQKLYHILQRFIQRKQPRIRSDVRETKQHESRRSHSCSSNFER